MPPARQHCDNQGRRGQHTDDHQHGNHPRRTLRLGVDHPATIRRRVTRPGLVRRGLLPLRESPATGARTLRIQESRRRDRQRQGRPTGGRDDAQLHFRDRAMHVTFDGLQRITERSRRPETLLRIQAHRSTHDGGHSIGHARPIDARDTARRCPLRDHPSRVIAVGHLEGRATHQQRPQRRAQRPHVLRRMDTRRTRDLLGRCPHDRKTIAAAARICPHMLRYTEIRQDRRAIGIHHDVAGLDITVHETHTMQHLRAATHADDHRQRPICRHRFLTHLIHDVRDRTVLHHQERPPILCGARAVQLYDSRMPRHERHHIRLAGDVPLRLSPTVQASDLHRDITTGHLLAAQVHVREPTRSEVSNPLVAGQHRGNPHVLVSVTHRFLLQRRVTRDNRDRHCPLVAKRRARRRQRNDLTDSAQRTRANHDTDDAVRVPASPSVTSPPACPISKDADLTGAVPSSIRAS